MAIDERIDRLLKHFNDQRRHDFWAACENVFQERGVEFDPIHEILRSEMIDRHCLLFPLSENNGTQISGDGLRVSQRGGWLQYLEELKIENDELTQLRIQNEKFERKHIKMNTRIQFGMLFCAVAGLFGVGYGIYQ